jgi:hypothetical protein
MIVIRAKSRDEAAPFSNLLPIVDLLARRGNSLVDGGFILTPAGWQCRLSDRMNLDLVLSEFVLPPSVETSVEYDTILDRLSWCVIMGPGAGASWGPRGHADPDHHLGPLGE